MIDMANLYFKYGTMNSGKSMQLIAFAHNLKIQGIPHLVMKSAIDTREATAVIHSRPIGEIPCEFIAKDDTIIYTPGNENKVVPEWILVDEAQFLSAEQIDRLAEIVDMYNINVVCYGLRSDFKTHLFEGSKRLFEIADYCVEIESICAKNRKNIINARIDKDGNIVTNGAQVKVGAEDLYRGMSRYEYMRLTHKYTE